jgi:glycerol-3-phosphate dehydrogenase
MSDTPLPQATLRADLIERLAQPHVYDLAIIGGGATGLGVALDAALRGLSVVLLESHDFAKGTSSRATKLVHGGVRYLAQGNISLVREALHERTTGGSRPFMASVSRCMTPWLAKQAWARPNSWVRRAPALACPPSAKTTSGAA